MTIEKDLKDALKAKKVVIGSNSVLRGVKTGNVKTIIHAANSPENLMKDLTYYTQIGNINMQKFDGSSKQLGELCGKPFNILLVGLKK